MTDCDIQKRERDSFKPSHDIKQLARDTEGIPENAATIVRERLKLAARLIERAAGRVGPRGYGTSWPEILKEAHDWFDVEYDKSGQAVGFKMVDRDQRPVLQPTARQISQAEEALSWRRYVAGIELEILNLWLYCQAKRRPWQRAAEEAGISRATAKRRLDRAFWLIAVGLSRDRLPLEPLQR